VCVCVCVCVCVGEKDAVSCWDDQVYEQLDSCRSSSEDAAVHESLYSFGTKGEGIVIYVK
jgi:DNA-binding transcriptional regulator/RsmH inhibitor MraZ